jgi:hypothetical protein
MTKEGPIRPGADQPHSGDQRQRTVNPSDGISPRASIHTGEKPQLSGTQLYPQARGRMADQRSHRRDHVRSAGGPVEIRYKPRHPTPPTVDQRHRRSRRPPALPTAKAWSAFSQRRYIKQTQRRPPKRALAGRAGLQDGQHKRQARHGVGRVGCGIPSTSPRATTRCPGGKPGKLGRWRGGMLPPGHRMVGLCQAAGMPHDSQHARSSMIVRQHGHHDLRHAAARAKRWGAYRARLTVNSRTR